MSNSCERDPMASVEPIVPKREFMGDTAAVVALLDRILHHAHVLKFGPRSWRMKQHADLRTQEVTQ